MQHGTYTVSLSSFFSLPTQSLQRFLCPFSESLVEPGLWLVLVLKVSAYGLSGSLALVVLVLCSCVLDPCLTFWIYLLDFGSLRPS